MIELSNGYCIDVMTKDRFALKQRYLGSKHGEPVDRYKLLSNHRSIEDALKAFQRLVAGTCDRGATIPISEYIKRLEVENAKTAEVIQNSMMEQFYVYVPVVTEGETPVVHPIADLIPIGRDNSITRAKLLELCVENELVDSSKSIATQDRAMRRLIEKARKDFVILNLSNGDGYYRVSREDMQDLQRYIKQEENRAKSAFKNLSMAKKLYEDYKHGRFEA